MDGRAEVATVVVNNGGLLAIAESNYTKKRKIIMPTESSMKI
jgi:hypothetical protein